jgi:broad specificity phosphatase PhoE
MRIYLVRHGQSEGNVNNAKYFEKLDCDIQLTDKGQEDALNAANMIMDLCDHVSGKNGDHVTDLGLKGGPYHFNLYQSSYTRAVQTAGIIRDRITSFEGYHINNVYETPLCREREWGSLRDILNSRLHTDEHWNFYYKPSGGESFANCFDRAALFHQYLLNTTKYENNIVVAHGEFNKLYLMYLMHWTVDEFNSVANSKNGEVFLIEDGKLSTLTPTTNSHH